MSAVSVLVLTLCKSFYCKVYVSVFLRHARNGQRRAQSHTLFSQDQRMQAIDEDVLSGLEEPS